MQPPSVKGKAARCAGQTRGGERDLARVLAAKAGAGRGHHHAHVPYWVPVNPSSSRNTQSKLRFG